MYKAIQVVLNLLVAALNYEASKHGKRSARDKANVAHSMSREAELVNRIQTREALRRTHHRINADVAQRKADQASALASKINTLK
ncbi:hypothetical protein Kurepalu1_00016 [Pseudomonas phage vB_PpuP-Kurepalu-1]